MEKYFPFQQRITPHFVSGVLPLGIKGPKKGKIALLSSYRVLRRLSNAHPPRPAVSGGQKPLYTADLAHHHGIGAICPYFCLFAAVFK